MTTLDIAKLLAEMTLQEKAALLDGADVWRTKPVPRLDVPSVMVADGPHGLRKETGPVLGPSFPATCFPTAVSLACTWDRDLLARVGVALGIECRDQQVAVLLGPGVNMKRTPLCGRNFEYFSEDPVLAGELGVALVNGIQSQGVGTSVKHFAANNQETNRMTVSAEIDERTLREIYLPAFERVITQAKPWTVMCSYNKINGVYASQNRWLLTEVLREEWGYDGLVVSDWGAIEDRVAALAAGLDLEMPSSHGAGTARILEAIERGDIEVELLDRAAGRVLALVDRAAPGLREPLTADFDAHHRLAYEAATNAAVLLRNRDDLLPLDPQAAGAIAVIGEFARTPRYQGAGSSQVNPTRLDDALSRLQAALDGSREVVFAPGYCIDPDETTPELMAEAVAAARDAAVAVVFVGLPPQYESEGYDRATMDLPPHQVELVRAIAAVNSRVVVVLANGGVVSMEPWHREVAAILECHLAGQAGGWAVADLLIGRAAPAGRLAETIPVRYDDNPTIGAFPGDEQRVRYGEGLLIGYRWYDAHKLEVAYPFGHGLTYTTFSYGAATATVTGQGLDAQVEIECPITNTGSRAGAEVVQVYVHDRECSAYRPPQELKAFTKVWLEPGETRTVRLTLTGRDLSFWNEAYRRWTVETGEFELRVGASSRDIRAVAVISVVGEDLPRRLFPNSLARTWLAHPVIGPQLAEKLRHAESGGEAGRPNLAGLLIGENPNPWVLDTPLSRLVQTPGFPVRPADLEQWLAAQ